MNIKALIRLCRPHQWVKNLLVLLPLAASHQISEVPLLLRALLACFIFCLTASSVYAFNDALDVESDRQHADKCKRPVASGEVSEHQALGLAFLLAGFSVSAAGMLSYRVLLCVCGYLLLNLLYTRVLKKLVLLDVICLTGFYLIRILTGHLATNVPFSPWLTAFALFLFFSLALMKRSSELVAMAAKGELVTSGRKYRSIDLQCVNQFGASSGTTSVLVLALYIDRGSQKWGHYQDPWLLWLLCPLVLYWLGRAWILTARGEMNSDPVLFALLDHASQVTAVVAICIFIFASVGVPL